MEATNRYADPNMADDQDYKVAKRGDFVFTTLPQLATHYRGEEILKFEKTYDWLKSFTSKKPDLDNARKAFFEDGARCIDALEKYTELLRLAVGNRELTVQHGPIYVMFISDFYRRIDPESISMETSIIDGGSASIIWDSVYELKNLWKSADKITSLESNKDFLQAAENICRNDKATDSIIPYYAEAKWAWESLCVRWDEICLVEGKKAEADDHRIRIAKKYKLDSSFSFEKALQVIKDEYVNSLDFDELTHFSRSIRGLANHVGCPRAHDSDAELNLTELRRFNSTQVPFLAKLQNDLLDKIFLIDKQQEIITALVFRHLIENLPDPKVPGVPATERWKDFWKAAVIKETQNQKNGTVGHPLESLGFKQSIVSVDNGNSDVTEQSTKGQKGLPYKIGAELYGLLSTNIHAYKNAKSNYQVRDDQWGEVTRQILKALIPKNFDTYGEVDWAAERLRY